MKQKKGVTNIGKLLSQFITRRPGLSIDNGLTIDELLSWEIWPIFIELSGML